jgi:hypothetical protein
MLNRLRILVLAITCLAAAQAGAQQATLTEAAAQSIRAVIEAQLAAFSADEAEKAFSFASDSIRETFGSAENFMRMVKTSYPVVYRPSSVSFLPPELLGEDVYQGVKMTDEDGQLWLAVYRMQRLADDSWRIAGCALKPLAGSLTQLFLLGTGP